MKATFFFIVLSMLCSLAHADAFDDKARAESQQEQAVAADRAHQKAFNQITQYNSEVVRRIPRSASAVTCFDINAFRYRRDNGCRLADSSWKGIPVQVCSETWGYGQSQNLPPEIVECHYHLPNGRDCQIFRNASLGAKCL